MYSQDTARPQRVVLDGMKILRNGGRALCELGGSGQIKRHKLIHLYEPSGAKYASAGIPVHELSAIWPLSKQ
jgi:hypothetical protein